MFSGIIGLLDESANLNLRIYKVECVDKKMQYDSIVIRKKEGTFRVR